MPELKDGEPNDFLTKLFAQVKANLAEESASIKPQQEAYEKTNGRRTGHSQRPGRARKTPLLPFESIRKLSHALTSQKELEAAFKARVKKLNFTYDAQVKAYVTKAEQ